MTGDPAIALYEPQREAHSLGSMIEAYFDSADPATQRHIYICADNWFRAKRVNDYFRATGGTLMTGLLPSSVMEIATFKLMWKRLQEGVLRSHKIPVFGMLERYQSEDGEKIDQLHAHLYMVFHDWVDVADIMGRVSDSIRCAWEGIHEATAGEPLGKQPMALEPPKDGTGEAFVKYM